MIYTIGHSTTLWDDFLQFLPPESLLIDVRSHPISSHNPQYNQTELIQKLGDKYTWWPQLGGWSIQHSQYKGKFKGVDLEPYLKGHFPKQRIAAKQASVKPVWTSTGLYDYSWFMTIPEFHEGVNKLLQLSDDAVIMCCEALYFKCHRSMIADYIVYKGLDAIHLLGRSTKTKGNRVSQISHRSVLSNRLERYDSDILLNWGARDATRQGEDESQIERSNY